MTQVLLVMLNTDAKAPWANTKRQTRDARTQGIDLENRLINDITLAWNTVAQKLADLDYMGNIGWMPGNHPYIQFKYKIFPTPMTFAEATRNCAVQQGSLLHGDHDITEFLPDLAPGTTVWFATKDTRAVRVMTEAEIQNFFHSFDTCYTVTLMPNRAVTADTRCTDQHQSVCTKILMAYQESLNYEHEILNIKGLKHSIEQEDVPIMKAIKLLLAIGHPETDQNHPAGLQQTIELLTSTSEAATNIATTMPLYPNFTSVMTQLQTTRNIAHTTLALIQAQHLINYAEQIDALTKPSKTTSSAAQAPPDSNDVEINSNGQNSAFSEDLYETNLSIEQLETELDRTKLNIATIQQTLQRLQQSYHSLERVSQTVTQNRALISSGNKKILDVSQRLTAWVSEAASQALPDESQAEIESQVNSTISSVAQFAIDFLEDESNIWIAMALTLILTIVAVTNSIYTCIYFRKASRRNETIKRHLQLSPKYAPISQGQGRLAGEELDEQMTRIEKIEKRLLSLEAKLAMLHQERQEQQEKDMTATKNKRTKRKNKGAAPQPYSHMAQN